MSGAPSNAARPILGPARQITDTDELDFTIASNVVSALGVSCVDPRYPFRVEGAPAAICTTRFEIKPGAVLAHVVPIYEVALWAATVWQIHIARRV